MMNRHAVVLGGSVAGLAAARAVAAHVERITIIERDALDLMCASPRRGVPQGNHGHGLLALGARTLEEWFPGMTEELIAEGALPGDVTNDFLWFQRGAWKLRADSGLRGVLSSRPLLERKIRQRVAGIPNVQFLVEHDVLEPTYDRTTGRVTRANVLDRRTGASAALDADLVIDATGRGSRAPRWLAAWGFGEVRTSTIRCETAYATAVFERRAGDLHGANGGLIAGTPPERRTGALFAVEGGRWICTLMGVLGDRPPTTLDGFRAFAASLPADDVFRVVAEREPLGPIARHRFSGSRRRHYAKMKDFPDGFVVLGDAVCSFNPMYGQGMSAAVAQAKLLGECLADGAEGVAQRFFARAEALVDTPWTVAASEDLRHPEVEGPRPVAFAAVNAYFDRLRRAATRDAVVLRRLFEVANLVRSPASLFAPSTVLRVALHGSDVRGDRTERGVAAIGTA